MTPPPVQVPPTLRWWQARPGGARWLDDLPGIVARACERWQVVPDHTLDSYVAFVVGVSRGHERFVLKVNFPEPESMREPDALRFWGGRGAVRLVDEAPAERVLLMQRILPGQQLWALPEEDALEAAVGLLGQLHAHGEPPAGFARLEDEALRWADELPRQWAAAGEPFERSLLDQGVQLARELAASQGEQLLLHQDLHGGNALQAGDGSWLAIDPKPLVGEREFDVASLLRDRRHALSVDPDPAARLRGRLDVLCGGLGLDRERARCWAIVHALAWAIEDGRTHGPLVDCARWLAAID